MQWRAIHKPVVIRGSASRQDRTAVNLKKPEEEKAWGMACASILDGFFDALNLN